MKNFFKKKCLSKIILVIFATLGSIPLLIFFVLIIYVLLFHFGANSNIEFIRDMTHYIDNKVMNTEYYDQRIIKDEVVLNGGKFVVTKNNNEFNLLMYSKYNEVEEIFSNGLCWDVSNDKIYIVGNKGYAVTYIDTDNNREKCKILMKEEDVFNNGKTNYPNDISILDNFNEFTKEEQKELLDIEENGSLFIDLN